MGLLIRGLLLMFRSRIWKPRERPSSPNPHQQVSGHFWYLICVFLNINFLLLDKRPADADADEEQKPKKKVGATARFLAENTADTETSGLKKKLKRTVSNEELATLTSIRCEQLYFRYAIYYIMLLM